MWSKKYNNMTLEEYLACRRKDDEENKEKVRQYNRELVAEYSFLLPRNRWTGKVHEDYDYSFTELDDLDRGWRIAFGEDLLKDLKKELEAVNYLDKYRISQIKEKYGSLRWYSFAAPENWERKILPKYANLSKRTCGICGKPAKWISQGWIYPYCDECKKELEDIEMFEKVEDYYDK